MIVLDTNVLSELTRPEPSAAVTEWLRSRDVEGLVTTAITVQEVMFGIELLGETFRAGHLRDAFEHIFDILGRRILPVTETSARVTAYALSQRRRSGHPLGFADAQIAGITIEHGATLATRNVRDFAGLPLAVVDPWHR